MCVSWQRSCARFIIPRIKERGKIIPSQTWQLQNYEIKKFSREEYWQRGAKSSRIIASDETISCERCDKGNPEKRFPFSKRKKSEVRLLPAPPRQDKLSFSEFIRLEGYNHWTVEHFGLRKLTTELYRDKNLKSHSLFSALSARLTNLVNHKTLTTDKENQKVRGKDTNTHKKKLNNEIVAEWERERERSWGDEKPTDSTKTQLHSFLCVLVWFRSRRERARC